MNADPDSPNQSPATPPVEPPTVRFFLQLFVIPMTIVTIIILVWLLFSWLAHLGTTPQRLIQRLRKTNDASWQNALTLADLLRHPDYEELRQDAAAAGELASILEMHLQTAGMDPKSIKARVFLCRALGEFNAPEVLPVLIKAATLQRDPVEVDVRRAAIEALAIHAQYGDSQQLQNNPELIGALSSASRAEPASAELRSAAAFALGVVGGDTATQRLAFLLGDTSANTRYNAATALCRHGDARAVPVLLEMLDPENEDSVRGEHVAGHNWKRHLVIKNGIRAALRLAQQNPEAELPRIASALQNIVQSDLKLFSANVRRGLRIEAKEALAQMESR